MLTYCPCSICWWYPCVDFLLNPCGFTTAWIDLNTTLPCYCKGFLMKPTQLELQLPLIPPVLAKHAKHLSRSQGEPYYSWTVILLVLWGTFRGNTQKTEGRTRVEKGGQHRKGVGKGRQEERFKLGRKQVAKRWGGDVLLNWMTEWDRPAVLAERETQGITTPPVSPSDKDQMSLLLLK